MGTGPGGSGAAPARRRGRRGRSSGSRCRTGRRPRSGSPRTTALAVAGVERLALRRHPVEAPVSLGDEAPLLLPRTAPEVGESPAPVRGGRRPRPGPRTAPAAPPTRSRPTRSVVVPARRTPRTRWCTDVDRAAGRSAPGRARRHHSAHPEQRVVNPPIRGRRPVPGPRGRRTADRVITAGPFGRRGVDRRGDRARCSVATGCKVPFARYRMILVRYSASHRGRASAPTPAAGSSAERSRSSTLIEHRLSVARGSSRPRCASAGRTFPTRAKTIESAWT